MTNQDLSLPYFWTGTFGEGEDSLPYIGSFDDGKSFLIMGTGGNGITFSMFAQEIMTDWIKGKNSEISNVCDPFRH